MTTQYIETLIVGAGQAGLSTGYHLRRLGRPFLIIDRGERIGDNWRRHYDSLRLYTPAKYSSLPGSRFPAEDRWSYPGKDQVADYLERYALQWDLPVRMHTAIDRLTAGPGGEGFIAHIGGNTIHSDNVVVATGTFGRTPCVPDFAARLDPGITQLHSSRYLRPAQLGPGPALVVGASHSGTDIAYELAATRPTVLCGRDCGQLPVRWNSRRIRVVLPVLIFAWRHIVTRRTPLGRKQMRHVRSHGGPMLRVKRADLAGRGVRRLTERVCGVRDGKPELTDGTVLDVRNVVWATGFRQVFDWIELPVFSADGWPREYRGVVGDAPGLFFCGLSFQYAFASMVFPGVGRDADYIARRIAGRTRKRTESMGRASRVPAARAGTGPEGGPTVAPPRRHADRRILFPR